MAKEEIVAGLQRGLAKGQSLEAAMMSFYNAGYSKEDIEDAAHFLQNPQLQQSSSPMSYATQPVAQPQQTQIKTQPQTAQPQQTPQTVLPKTQPVAQPQQTPQTVLPKTQSVTQPQSPFSQQSWQMPVQQKQPIQSPPGQQPTTVQKVSAYGKKPSSFWTIVTFVLIFFLLALIGALIAIFLFREEIINFLNEIFLPLIKIKS